jgi:Ca2+-binding EF-hand superfamily protein
MKMVYNIDRDHNGYITTTELDDILKITYPKELMNVNLKSTLKPFCSSSNKVLLDYRYFRDFIKDFLEGKKNVDPSSAIDPSTGKVKTWENVPG